MQKSQFDSLHALKEEFKLFPCMVIGTHFPAAATGSPRGIDFKLFDMF